MATNRADEAELTSLLAFDSAWLLGKRLGIMMGFAIFGCWMNVFYIASFLVQDELKRKGLLFQASVGFSDLFMTAVVIPIAVAILASGQDDSKAVCYSLQFLTEASTYNYSIFFAMMSFETFYRLSKPADDYVQLFSKRIHLIACFVFVSTFAAAGVGVYFGLDYDCCYRSHSGNLAFRIITIIIFHILPFGITIYYSIGACMEMSHRASVDEEYRNSMQYRNDWSDHYINIAAFILYVAAWIPILVLIYGFPYTSHSTLYRSVWVGVSRSVLTSVLYGVLNRNFRQGFTYLIIVCCCKDLIADPIVRHQRRACQCQYDVEAGIARVRYSPRRPDVCPRSPDVCPRLPDVCPSDMQ